MPLLRGSTHAFAPLSNTACPCPCLNRDPDGIIYITHQRRPAVTQRDFYTPHLCSRFNPENIYPLINSWIKLQKKNKTDQTGQKVLKTAFHLTKN